MNGEPLLSLEDARMSFGAQPILDGAALTIHAGDRIGLIGRNGTGKSTLLSALAGMIPLDDGKVVSRKDLRVAMLRQRCDLNAKATVDEILDNAVDEVHEVRRRYEAEFETIAELEAGSDAHDAAAEEIEWLHHQADVAGVWHIDQEKSVISTALNLPPADALIGPLSGGEKRRIDIAATVLRRPDVLLLDEPTNHIDIESVEWIEQFLARYAGSCVVVTHDRYFLDRIANRIAELDAGQLLTVPGNYEKFLAHKAVLAETEARAMANRESYLKRELEWLRRAPKARGTKQKARIARFHEWAEDKKVRDIRDPTLLTPPPPRLGKRILEADDLAMAYGDKNLFSDFHIIMQKGMRVGIVGPNGCGKSTLLKSLTGRLKPDAGRVFVGDHVRFVQVDQLHEDVDPEDTVLDFLTDGQREIVVDEQKIYVPAFLEKFLFDQSVVNMRMKYLSGGEHNRLDLCRKFLRGGNFLVLDEPTNDLDLPTLRVLEEAVANFDGCAFIVSHDRYFLDRVCTHLVVFEGNGTTVTIDGGYDDYRLFRERVPKESDEPAKKGPTKTNRTKEETARKLSYKEKREIEAMENRIESAETRLAECEAAVSAPDFYTQEQEVVQEGLKTLEAAKSEVEELYARWEELESIAGGSGS